MLTGGQTATETGHASRAEPLAIRMLWPLAALACIGGIFLCYHVWLIATDNIGTFHNVAKSADLDSDGDLDVVLNNVRQESEFTAFAVTTLWVNQGDGQFVARRLRGCLFQRLPRLVQPGGRDLSDGCGLVENGGR